MALVRVYCGLASAERPGQPEVAGAWLTAAVVDDAGRLLDVCELTDDANGYAQLGALLTERSSGPTGVAIAADSDDHLVTMLLTAAGRPLAFADDDSVDDYAERFADDESIEEIESPAAERRAVGLARALQAGVLSAVALPAPRDLAALKPVLAAHAAIVVGRQAAAIALREVLREIYPAALRAYPDPAEPVSLAVLDALPEPGMLGLPTTPRSRDNTHVLDSVATALTATGVADAGTVAEAITALRVAVAETPRRGGVSKSLTNAVAHTVRHAVAAVRACDAASSALIGALAERANPPSRSRMRVNRLSSAPVAAPTPLRPVSAPRPVTEVPRVPAPRRTSRPTAPAAPTFAPAAPAFAPAALVPPPAAYTQPPVSPVSATPVSASPVIAAQMSAPPYGAPPPPPPPGITPIQVSAPPTRPAHQPVSAPPGFTPAPPRPVAPAASAMPPAPPSPPVRHQPFGPRPTSTPPGLEPLPTRPVAPAAQLPPISVEPANGSGYGIADIPVPLQREPERAAPGSRANWPLSGGSGALTGGTAEQPFVPYANGEPYRPPAAYTPLDPYGGLDSGRAGRVAPPWQADDMPPEPPMLRLVEPPPLADPALRDPLTDDLLGPDLSLGVRLDPPSLRLVEGEGGRSSGRPKRGNGDRFLDMSERLPEMSDNDDGDLLIFAATKSAWFTGRTNEDDHIPSWDNLSDEGWRAAESASRPTIDANTSAGLPKRVPQANLVPGSPLSAPDRPLRIVRDPDSIAAHTTGYFRGWRKGREIGGYAVGGRPGRDSAHGWDFSRDHGEQDDYASDARPPARPEYRQAAYRS